MLKEKQDNLRLLGQKQFEMRKAKHMTQLQLADALNVDYRVISRYETGQAEPGALYYDRLLDICDQKPQGEAADLLQLFSTLIPENRAQLMSLARMMNMAQKNRSNRAQQKP
jgi:transcriptional regulator with XRE-family HTH domain